jgi:hypothetical protein
MTSSAEIPSDPQESRRKLPPWKPTDERPDPWKPTAIALAIMLIAFIIYHLCHLLRSPRQ